MIGSIKYFPLKLRSVSFDDDLDYKTVSFTNETKKTTINIEKNIFTVNLPRHKSPYAGSIPIYEKNTSLDNDRWSVTGSTNERWLIKDILAREWAFWIAWFGGPKTVMKCFINIYTPGREETKFENTNFLYAKGFENAVFSYFEQIYGHDRDYEKIIFPADWEPIFLAGVPGARFRIVLNRDRKQKNYLAFPITEKHFIIICLSHSASEPKLIEEITTLFDSIFKSISFRPSPELAEKIQQINKDSKNEVSDHIAPLPWPL